MIIILEGPDGSGKSTLARQLSDTFGLHYHHEGVPPKNISALEHYGAVLDSFRGKNVVIDRLALGERVYGPILRGKDSLGEDGWLVFRRLIRAVNALEILCLPPFNVCHKAWASGRDELIRDDSKFAKTYEAFYELRGKQLVYNYQQVDSWYNLKSHLHSNRAIYDNAVSYPNYVGTPSAEYLFVGDIGSNPTALHDLPFFATVGCSAYLTKAIHAAHFDEAQIGFINAYRHDGRFNLIPWESKHVIMLGARASQALDEQGLTSKNTRQVFHRVPHPQYWKRFKSDQFHDYIRMLEECR